MALKNMLPQFLADTKNDTILAKFLLDTIDLNRSDGLRIGSILISVVRITILIACTLNRIVRLACSLERYNSIRLDASKMTLGGEFLSADAVAEAAHERVVVEEEVKK
jgi:hypothetical protein